MANADLFLSADGLSKLKDDEGTIAGLYNDPSGFCTFGVGHLVHQKDKWSCFMLEAAAADETWKKNVAKQWSGKPYETAYLTCGTAFMDKFADLKTKSIETAKTGIAQKKYGKAFDKLSTGEQETVTSLAAAAVDEQAKVLAKTADAVLKEDVTPFEKAVRDNVTESLTQAEFDALVSLSFNIGASNFASSGLVKEINKGKHKTGEVKDRKAAITAIEAGFAAWNKSKGVVLDGLTKRRAKEADRFLEAARADVAELEKKTSAAGAAPGGPAPTAGPKPVSGPAPVKK